MLLAVDVGNTNIVVGCFAGEELCYEFRLRTEIGRCIAEYEVLFLSLFERKFGKEYNIDRCILSSVVPPITADIVKLIEHICDVPVQVVDPAKNSGMLIHVVDASAVGSDRIVNALALKTLYGAPALAIDFGTATSFDYVNKKGEYEGGIIAPGVKLALKSLVDNAAKLPRIELCWPEKVMANDTVTAMQSGTAVGYMCLVDGMIERIIAEKGPLAHIIATGGEGELFAKHSSKITAYEANLTLKGLRILAEMS